MMADVDTREASLLAVADVKVVRIKRYETLLGLASPIPLVLSSRREKDAATESLIPQIFSGRPDLAGAIVLRKES